MQRIRKKSDRVLAMLLSLIMLIGMLPLSTLTAFAAETEQTDGHTINFTSNNMEQFDAIFGDVIFDGWKKEEKTPGTYSYTTPTYKNGQYDGGTGIKSNFFSVAIKSISSKAIAAITFTYGNQTYGFRIEDVQYTPNPSGSKNITHYMIKGTEIPRAGIYWLYNSRTGDFSIVFNYFDITEDVTISVNFVSNDLMNAGIQTTDDEHILDYGWTYGSKAGEYLIYALPETGWYVDYWEYSFNNHDFFRIEGTEGKTYLPVTPTDETDYRAVINQYSWGDAKLNVSVWNRTGITFDSTLTDNIDSSIREKVTDSYITSLADMIELGNDIELDLLNITEADDIKAVVVTIAGETWVLDHVYDQKRSEQVSIQWGNSFMAWNNCVIISGLNQELARQLTAENGIDVKIIYEDPKANNNVTTLTADSEMGSVPSAIAIEGQYLLIAIPEEGYAFDYWEYAEGTNATEGFQKAEDSDGKANLMVPTDKAMTYRAVFISADQKAIDFISSEMGIRDMVYINKPRQVMLNNHPDPIPIVPTVNDNQSFFLLNGSLELVDLAHIEPKSSTVIAGDGAQLWFTFRYYKVPKDIMVKVYSGNQVEENKLLKTVTADELSENVYDFSSKKGTAICYVPVAGMPYTDQVTVVFTANGVTAQKTLPLEIPMAENNKETEKISSTLKIIKLYDALVEGLKEKSSTYTYSSEYLMLKEELVYGLKEVSEAETEEAVSTAEKKALTYLDDTANGLYHHGVDVCISIADQTKVVDGMRIVRVPEIECIFVAMTAAMEQAYPDGHWFYNVGLGAFGVFFGYAGYRLNDGTDIHPAGISYDAKFAASTYAVGDYWGNKTWNEATGRGTNGLSLQCVWDGAISNTPTHFDSTGAPNTLIAFNARQGTLAWDLARLRQHYSDEELIDNAIYADALDKQTGDNDADSAADKALRIEYADFFLLEETEATRKVVKQIGVLTEQSAKADVDKAYAAYNALSDDEKRGVFNYEDLLPLLDLKENELTALEIDLKINNIGTVEYTNEILAKIKEARNAYDNANADAEALVTKLDTLTSAEKAFAALVEEKKAEFVDAVGKLPSTIVYPDSKAAIDAAQSVWKSLLKDEQNALSAEKAILDKAQAEYENAKAEYYSSRLDGALERVLKYIDKTVTNPQVGSVGGEWAVLAQARAGVEKDEYYDSYYKTVAEYVASIGSNKLDERKSTENSRVILALSSIGKNATNVGGYDLTAPYADFSWVKKQGLNGVIFALLALDSSNYEIPENSSVSNQTTRENLIDEILNAELENGGWSYSGDDADPDMTAMALQALAPYREQKEVTDAINRALIVLQSLQNSDGSFGSDSANSGANVESTSQVIIALLTLGINPVEDDRFIKGNTNPFTAILAYQLDNGGFEHEIGSGIDQMATEQAAMALTAYQRFLNSESALYVMTDREQVVDPFVPDEKDDENNNSPSDMNKSDLTTAADISTTENTDDKNNGSKKSPMTGNESYDISYLGMILMPFTVLAVIAFKRRKDNFKNSV